jgi:hypothetical protein
LTVTATSGEFSLREIDSWIARLIARHDEWLKRKWTDGRCWYDIIADTLDENWHDDDDAEFAYDAE